MVTVEQIQEKMFDFIENRLAEKLEKETNEEKRQKLREDHVIAVWIARAAKRINQHKIATRLRLATHAIKYSHPDARGSSLFSDGCEAAGESLVGTHSLGSTKSLDVVGNAASLDVYKFLSVEIEGIPLWQWAKERHATFIAALPGSDEEKSSWCDAFASFSQNDPNPMSHPLAKQVYWPVGDDEYHLLQPMFPSSLAHSINRILNEARFSDSSKEARAARRQGKDHPHGFRDWPDHLSQKFGGTKPQNISQLNSDRRGEILLLAAVPPSWQMPGRRYSLPLHTNTLFKRLPYEFVREAGELARFLASVSDWTNLRIREARKRRVEQIVDDLISYGFSFADEAYAGWTNSDECHLDLVECYWLDPNRQDEDFQQSRNSTDWPRTIADRFGSWLNNQLHSKANLAVGDVEHAQWLSEFESDFADHLREIRNV